MDGDTPISEVREIFVPRYRVTEGDGTKGAREGKRGGHRASHTDRTERRMVRWSG